MESNDKPQTMPNNIPPFVKFCCANLPAVFDDSLSYYEALCALWKYLQDCINTINNNAALEEEYISKFNLLKEYIDHYFDNLDVQNEINNKLDEMYANGQLNLLFARYVDNYVESTNERMDEMDVKIDALTDISPKVVTDASAMTDHDEVYVLTTDNKWYYWNGSAWVAGGTYNSDVTVDLIKWYLNDIASDGNSVYNPFNAEIGALKSADGTVDTTNTSYWVTDYIDISDYTQSSGNYRFLAFAYNNVQSLLCYKACIYDENKDFVYVSSTRKTCVTATDNTDISDWKYVRLQFVVAEIPFADRYKVSMMSGTDSFNIATTSRYTAVDVDGIAKGGIENVSLSDKLYESNVYTMLDHSVMPFEVSDFSYGTIDSTTGYTRNTDTRICLGKTLKVPAGTAFTLSNDWNCIAFAYNANGSYAGRYVTDWTSEVYFASESITRFVFKNSTIGNVNSVSAIQNLLQNITITKNSGGFGYSGDKVVLENTFYSVSAGLKTYGQDSANYGDILVCFNNSGYYKVQNIYGDPLKASTALDMVSTYAPHSNSSCFGTEKYDADDNYPLLYTNAYNTAGLPKGALYCYRLKNDFTTTLEQQILIGFTEDPIWAGNGSSVRPYGNFVIDTDNNKLYAYVMIDSLNVTRFFKFDLPELSDGAVVTLQQNDIEDYFDIPWMYYMQGCCYYNGKIYATSGFTSADCKLHVVDLVNKRESSTVPLGSFAGEPETAFVYDNKLYVSSGSTLYRMEF